MNDAGELRKNFVDPPIKDTVQITGGGYAVIRFTPTPGIKSRPVVDFLLYCSPIGLSSPFWIRTFGGIDCSQFLSVTDSKYLG